MLGQSDAGVVLSYFVLQQEVPCQLKGISWMVGIPLLPWRTTSTLADNAYAGQHTYRRLWSAKNPPTVSNPRYILVYSIGIITPYSHLTLVSHVHIHLPSSLQDGK
jgi:hypothetical protein